MKCPTCPDAVLVMADRAGIVAAGQGVAAPGFRIAVNQRLGHGVKEQGSDADAALAKVGQLFGNKRQGRGLACTGRRGLLLRRQPAA